MIKNWLLCDFHIHTNLSDGKLSLQEVVDFYGSKGFDVISITDHVLDSMTLTELKRKGKSIGAIRKRDFQNYLRLLWQESQRAWETYKMLLLPGVEITNNCNKYHILAIDVKCYIDPGLPVEKIVNYTHEQGAIAIACHPHHKTTEGPYVHLWENHEKYAPLFDAWEVANRDDLFNVIGIKKFNYIATSDLHEPQHIYSWKTLIKCEKNPEAIKTAIRENREVAIYLFREKCTGEHTLETKNENISLLPNTLTLLTNESTHYRL